MNFKECTLTSVPGIKVGHAHNQTKSSGCTVVICPQHTVCAFDQRGGGFGTRDTDFLRNGKLIDSIDALAFSGCSTFGLSVSDGVLHYLRENNRGLKTAGGRIPVVPTAIIYDLLSIDGQDFVNASTGYEAAKNASFDEVSSGRLGAGLGATVGKWRGIEHAKNAGIGNAGTRIGKEVVVSVMLIVNSFGEIDETPAHTHTNSLSPAESALIFNEERKFTQGQNTVVGVVATNARLNKNELKIVAEMAQSGLSRIIFPSHTPFDGDTIFAISTGRKTFDVLSIASLAQKLTTVAVLDALESSKKIT